VVCYLCSILDEKTKAERSILADSPAATKKVLDVCRALKNKVERIYVLSMGRGKQLGEKSTYAATVKRLTSLPVLYASFSPILFFTYLISSFSLIVLMFRIRKKTRGRLIHVIAYNRQWLYLPVLIIARVLKMKCYLDLEDGEIIENHGVVKKLTSRLNKFLFDCVCSHGSILVSSELAEQVKTKRNIICYGVAEKYSDVTSCQWDKKPMHFLLGGSLLRETGVCLLIDAVKILNSKYSTYRNKIIIDVTGYGEMADELAELSKGAGEGWLIFHGRVSVNQYNLILKKSHVGLCLKLPSSGMGMTTFPSKTIEIASFGKLLLTTKLSHVFELFGEDGACYLANESGECLAEMIVSIVENPLMSMQTAQIGQKRLLRMCNAEHVADDICSLLEGAV